MNSKRKPRPLRSDEELADAAKDVSYEIEMLVVASLGTGFVTLASVVTNRRDDERIMALESSLLRYHDLRAFLCPSLQGPAKDDDVLASDYLGVQVAADV